MPMFTVSHHPQSKGGCLSLAQKFEGSIDDALERLQGRGIKPTRVFAVEADSPTDARSKCCKHNLVYPAS